MAESDTLLIQPFDFHTEI